MNKNNNISYSVSEFLKSLKWDGKNHIAELYETMTLESERSRYHKDGKEVVIDLKQVYSEYFTKWLVGCVASIIGRDDEHNNIFLILRSEKQGLYTIHWLSKLLPEKYMHIEAIAFCDKYTLDLIAEKMLIVFECIDKNKISDIQKIKRLITMPIIRYRKAYARDSIDRKRLASFAGTLNDSDILIDDQNRRFLIFEVSELHHQHDVNIEQVWAQAVRLYEQGYKYYLENKDIELLNQLNKY